MKFNAIITVVDTLSHHFTVLDKKSMQQFINSNKKEKIPIVLDHSHKGATRFIGETKVNTWKINKDNEVYAILKIKDKKIAKDLKYKLGFKGFLNKAVSITLTEPSWIYIKNRKWKKV